MDDFYRRLGERIRKLRNEVGFSQEEFSKRLGINRVSISQIEKGERKISAEEIIKISRIFNTSPDNLLIKKEIEITLERRPKQKRKGEIRISVPQKNIEKFKEVLLYILNRVGAKPSIGETVLYKLLYFIDFNFYEKYEEQLTGATYIKNHYGPTPIEFKKIVESMEGKSLIKITGKYFNYPQTKYLPLREPNLNKLEDRERKTIDEVLNKLSDMNATEISDYSHKDVPWLITEDGGIIDYESVFYRTLPYSVRHYSEEDI
jgi:transcriptional regulator with XRE-family HTH domain